MGGVTPDYFSAREWIVADGQEMTPDNDARAARVLLLGTTLRDKLFGDADAIGASLRIRDVPFTVIGILERKGQSVWGEDQDDVALVPLTTARRHFVGTSRASPRFVHNITVKFGDASTAEDVMAAIADLLRQRHGLGASRDESFLISNLAEAAGVEETTSRVVSTMLTAVASVSLVVGGIGVMNIMLVTVAERTREIGLRLAVGARRRDVVAQFLVEAAALATLGGVVGAVAGLAGAVAIGAFAGWPVVIDLSALIAAVAIAAITGLVFGVFPAVRAARLDPMAALRME
nr:ABC transporter permease [Limibaculum sediminis]